MKLDLRKMLAGETHSLPISFTLTPPSANDAMSSLYRVTFPAPLAVSGEILNNAGYMRMTLSLSLSYIAPCARCLADVHGEFSFDVERTVVPEGMLANISEEEADDYAIVRKGFLDMDEELLELLELNFPTKFLCSDDCKGFCPRCGKNLNEGDCTCNHKEIDPRLEPLKKLLLELEAEEKGENN